MKKKRWKLAGIFLMAALTVPSLGGCKVGNTQIRLSSGQLRNHNAIVRINDHKYDIRYAKLYLCNYRNLYGKAYGTDLWESYDADLEQYVKDVTIQELTHIACMDILAENQDMHLSEQEKKQAARAAKEYYQSLTEEEKTFIGLYEREIRTAYEEYALAEKLYHALTQGTDEEISDDEARVVRVQQIYVKDKLKLNTTAIDLISGTHEAIAKKDVTIRDNVDHFGLIKGQEYVLKGILMDQTTGKPLVINGKQITAEKSVQIETADGTVPIDFTLDASELNNRSIVVYEYLYHNGQLNASHEDITDEDQTITFKVGSLKPTLPPNKGGGLLSALKTGDFSDIMPFAIALIGTGAIILSIVIYNHRKKKKREE